jgi:putative acetyltransferase
MRPMLPEDVPLLAEIFRASIEELTGDDYSEAQQAAGRPRTMSRVGGAFAGELTLVATHGAQGGGFAALADNARRHALRASGGGCGRRQHALHALEKPAPAWRAKELTS